MLDYLSLDKVKVNGQCNIFYTLNLWFRVWGMGIDSTPFPKVYTELFKISIFSLSKYDHV